MNSGWTSTPPPPTSTLGTGGRVGRVEQTIRAVGGGRSEEENAIKMLSYNGTGFTLESACVKFFHVYIFFAPQGYKRG